MRPGLAWRPQRSADLARFRGDPYHLRSGQAWRTNPGWRGLPRDQFPGSNLPNFPKQLVFREPGWVDRFATRAASPPTSVPHSSAHAPFWHMFSNFAGPEICNGLAGTICHFNFASDSSEFNGQVVDLLPIRIAKTPLPAQARAIKPRRWPLCSGRPAACAPYSRHEQFAPNAPQHHRGNLLCSQSLSTIPNAVTCGRSVLLDLTIESNDSCDFSRTIKLVQGLPARISRARKVTSTARSIPSINADKNTQQGSRIRLELLEHPPRCERFRLRGSGTLGCRSHLQPERENEKQPLPLQLCLTVNHRNAQ